MIRIERRLDARLTSAVVLKELMKLHGFTLRSLADASNVLLAKKRGSTIRVSHSTIGHLMTGERKSCKPEVAKAIAEVLHVPVALLFAVEVSRVSREVQRVAA